MKEIIVKEVHDKHGMDDFVALPRRLYAGNPCYVPDLDVDVRETFDRKKNVCLEDTDIQAFVAYDGDGNAVGRIAAIINRRANEKWHTKYVRFGFIEFEDDRRISSALLAAAENWGRAKGMTRIQGPMGIFDLDKEGMLVEDFDRQSSIITIYNPPYYPEHIEALGFEKEVDWVQMRIKVPKEVPAIFLRAAKVTREHFGLRTRTLTDKELKNGYGHKIFHLINQTYSSLFGYTELTDKQTDMYISRYLSLIDKQMMPVVENDKGELIGVAVTMGSLSEALRKTGGRLLPFGWWHLLRSLKIRREDTAELMLIAVHPDYQGTGVNALFFEHLIPVYNRYGMTWAETGPQLEHNLHVLSQWKHLDATTVKRRRCYGKEIG